MIIAVFDVDTGQCLQIRDAAYGNLSDYPLAKELTKAVDPSSIWYNKLSRSSLLISA